MENYLMKLEEARDIVFNSDISYKQKKKLFSVLNEAENLYRQLHGFNLFVEDTRPKRFLLVLFKYTRQEQKALLYERDGKPVFFDTEEEAELVGAAQPYNFRIVEVRRSEWPTCRNCGKQVPPRLAYSHC